MAQCETSVNRLDLVKCTRQVTMRYVSGLELQAWFACDYYTFAFRKSNTRCYVRERNDGCWARDSKTRLVIHPSLSLQSNHLHLLFNPATFTLPLFNPTTSTFWMSRELLSISLFCSNIFQPSPLCSFASPAMTTGLCDFGESWV